MKTKIELTSDDPQKHAEYKKGDFGYVDGYVRGGNNIPLACVVIGEKVILVPVHALKVIA